tara:strand:+ start:2925 stop:3131 length:207 start_codon:yes stop_codon:yes gene_type:complete
MSSTSKTERSKYASQIVMPEEQDELHIMVDNIEVVVKRTDEGVVVDLSSDKENPNEELIASTYAFFHE